MPVYSFRKVQLIPASLDEVWTFFSAAENLPRITPKYMRFTVISAYHSEAVYAGQIIEYKLRPLLGIPMYWMTEITHVKDKTYFVDEQRFGPYSLWHHQHHFKAVEGGVEMTDIVHYKIPFGFLGRLANTLFVRKQLNDIFAFRKQQTEQLFGG